MNAIQNHVTPPRIPKWTVIGAIDATASDLEHFELERVDELERVPKTDANVIMEVRRNPVSKTAQKVKNGLLASLAPAFATAGVAVGAVTALTGGPLLIAAGAVAFGALEGGLLYTVSKSAFEKFRFIDKQSAEPEWKGTRQYLLGTDPNPGINSPVLSETKSTHAPSGQKLGAFVADSMKKYPAQRYALIVGGHGRAMSTIGDMPVEELAKATEVAHTQTGRKVDMLVLDSCLVGNLETLLPMADHVRYAIVSEEPVYTSVIDWGGILGDVQRAPASANAFAASAMDRAQGNYWNQTLSTVRMSKMKDLRTAVENLGTAIQTSIKGGHRGEVKKAFAAATKIQDSDKMSRFMEQKLDLGNLIQHLAHDVDDPQLKQAANQAWQAYSGAVVDHRKSAKFAGTTGLSIQGPRALHTEYAYAKETGLNEWSKALGQMKPWPMRMVSAAVGGVMSLFR